MKKIIKITFCILCALIIVFAFAFNVLFNYTGYKGEYQDMYTVAVNNVFGISGYISNGEALSDPEIQIIETDEFGRTLFFYSEHTEAEPDFGMAFIVMQKSENGYVYYYQDKCYIPYFYTVSDWSSISEKYDTAVLQELKELNDWNREFNEEKCVKLKADNKKSEGKIHPKKHTFNEIIYNYETKNGYAGEDKSFFQYSEYCETDAYGRELYFVCGMTMNTAENGENISDCYNYAIIFNADGTCSDNGIIRIEDIAESFNSVNELKENNNWNSEY